MTGAISAYTTNYRLAKINFNYSTWHTEMNQNLDDLDVILKAAVAFIAASPYKVSTAYVAGDLAIDSSNYLIYQCAVNHTSHASNTFAQARAANPTYWTIYSRPSSAMSNWTTATAYQINQIVHNTTAYQFAVCIVDHTSGTYATDVAANKWVVILDYSSIGADVATLAALDTEITALGAITSDITGVNAISADVTSVAAIDTNVSVVAAIDTEVTTVAGIAADVTTVAGVAGDLAAYAFDPANPGAIGGTTPAAGTFTTLTGSTSVSDGDGSLRTLPKSGSSKTSSYSLVVGDVGNMIEVGSGGSITIPDATFATGDVVMIFNNTSGNITITCSITTAYIGGTDSDKATMTLATRGIATVVFISGTVCVVTGNVS